MTTETYEHDEHGETVTSTDESVPHERDDVQTQEDSGKVNQARVRRWAREHEIDVPDRGRIPDAIVQQYLQRDTSSPVESRVDDELEHDMQPWRPYKHGLTQGRRQVEMYHRGDDVLWLQAVLGVTDDRNGEFGQSTYDAVMAYQRAIASYLYMPVDGVVGRHTWGVLRGANFVTITALKHAFRHAQRAPGVAEVQARLAARGYPLWRATGVADETTRQMFERYCRRTLDPVHNGEPDRESLTSLGFRVTE